MQTNNKLREALEALLNLAYEVEDMNSDSGPRTSMPTKFVIDTAKAALSEPIKNCEVGTADEQLTRHGDWCAMRPTTAHPCLDRGWCRKCFADWSQMPYEGGGNDGNE